MTVWQWLTSGINTWSSNDLFSWWKNHLCIMFVSMINLHFSDNFIRVINQICLNSWHDIVILDFVWSYYLSWLKLLIFVSCNDIWMTIVKSITIDINNWWLIVIVVMCVRNSVSSFLRSSWCFCWRKYFFMNQKLWLILFSSVSIISLFPSELNFLSSSLFWVPKFLINWIDFIKSYMTVWQWLTSGINTWSSNDLFSWWKNHLCIMFVSMINLHFSDNFIRVINQICLNSWHDIVILDFVWSSYLSWCMLMSWVSFNDIWMTIVKSIIFNINNWWLFDICNLFWSFRNHFYNFFILINYPTFVWWSNLFMSKNFSSYAWWCNFFGSYNLWITIDKISFI